MPVDSPFVVVEGEGREQRIVAASNAARCCGVRPGLRLNEAYALTPALQVQARDPTAEHEALECLAAWSGQFTSCVSPVRPDVLLLEIGGSRSLYAGIDRLLTEVRLGMVALGYRARLAVAPTPLGATWLARCGQEVKVTDHGSLFSVLAKLPVTCLELEPQVAALLTGLGLKTLLDCLRLPRDGIARRAGPQVLNMLDRAFGRLPDPRAAFVPPERFRARLGFPVPVTTREALLFPLHRLLRELTGFLMARGAGVSAFEIVLQAHRAAPQRMPLTLLAPSRDTAHLIRLARERLERLTLTAPVEEIRLEAEALVPLASQPADLFTGTYSPEEACTKILERLQARLGREAVQSLALHADHRPEHAWRYSAPHLTPAAETVGHSDFVRTVPRPLWLLPAPVMLEVRGGRPYWGGTLQLASARERLQGGWWDGNEIARDYFIARHADGRRLWIFCELRTAQWFLHGIFA